MNPTNPIDRRQLLSYAAFTSLAAGAAGTIDAATQSAPILQREPANAIR